VCREHGIAWVPFFPLGSAGYGTTRTVTGDPAVTAIARELAVTPAQVALAWLLAHYDSTLLIPGTADPARLAGNIAAGTIRFPADATAALDNLAPPPGDFPEPRGRYFGPAN
jgi:pyridoxine 4-dehydrogenase